jgi:hypothetical protein
MVDVIKIGQKDMALRRPGKSFALCLLGDKCQTPEAALLFNMTIAHLTNMAAGQMPAPFEGWEHSTSGASR